MDEEKASGVVIRTSMDTNDKQCVCLIFIPFSCLHLGQLEGHFEQSSRPPLQDVHIRAHCPTSWFIHGICVWPPLLYVPRIFSLVYCLIRFSIYYDNACDLPRRVS